MSSKSLLVQRAQSILVPEDDETGSPLPDKEGLTVSTSWAILNTSTQSSPHLSPVSSETSIVEEPNDNGSLSIINGLDDTDLSATGDGTHTNTMLEAPFDESTFIESKREPYFSSLIYKVI